MFKERVMFFDNLETSCSKGVMLRRDRLNVTKEGLTENVKRRNRVKHKGEGTGGFMLMRTRKENSIFPEDKALPHQTQSQLEFSALLQ
jgi:hypothetical protein